MCVENLAPDLEVVVVKGNDGSLGFRGQPWWRVWEATTPSQLNSFAYLAVNFAGTVAHKLFESV